ncbi:type VI secretion system baseplate subunit TssG [Thiohalorhabdus methylotrophus]|uniref:Type VI secretion system baseplate subunit TssG n=1 Tax=Thiohalorhabdus methylotrophus TaxID=3242694 RepID=A0ABV4TTE0_9GAMM
MIAQLENSPGSFGFLQALRILRRALRREGRDPEQCIRIRPDLSQARPARAVEAVERDADGTYWVTVNLPGLYGARSPLPRFYTEDLLAANQEDQPAPRLLLDALHARLYHLWYRARLHGRPAVAAEEGDRRFSGLVAALVGFEAEGERSDSLPARESLRYVKLLGPRQRSAQGLAALLRDAFPGVEFRVRECVPRRVRVPASQRLSLGRQANRLGQTTVVGDEIRERKGKLQVEVGPVDAGTFARWVNDRVEWRRMVRLVRAYLKAPLECELVFRLAPGTAGSLCLGDPDWARLGQSGWLFSGDAREGGRAVLPLV